jgi:3-hydroxyacyl-[acyl-carrier-protein] dehydratase
MKSLNKSDIAELLPHREPMLLIDELHDIVDLKSATAVVNVKKNSFFVQGHFPDNPVMPGVLPNCKLILKIEAIRSHGRVWKYKGDAYVDQIKMADAIWSATIVDKK